MADDGPFFETFDATAARISQSHLAAKLNQGPRDDAGRFRITKGTSSLATPEEKRAEENRERGVTLVDPTKAVYLHTVKRAADAPREREKTKKAKKEKKDGDDADDDAGPPSWLSLGLVVKILDKSSAHRKRKGVVRKLPRKGVAELEVLGVDAAATETVAEKHLETVLPAVGKHVRVVKGEAAGRVGELRKIHETRFLAEVALDAADGVRQRVEFLQYDEVCKVQGLS